MTGLSALAVGSRFGVVRQHGALAAELLRLPDLVHRDVGHQRSAHGEHDTGRRYRLRCYRSKMWTISSLLLQLAGSFCGSLMSDTRATRLVLRKVTPSTLQ